MRGRPTTPGARRWAAGAAVALLVLLAGALSWALVPHRVQATAVVSVTPRTDAGADASRLLTDRYAALAGSAATARAAVAGGGARTVDAGALQRATTVQRTGGGTVAVTVALPTAGASVAAANALVDALVAEGAGEELVDVRPASEAVAGTAVATPSPGRWAGITVLAALLLGPVAAALVPGRLRDRAAPVAGPARVPLPVAAARPAVAPAVVDDLAAFRDAPPGSPVPAVPPPPAEASAAKAPPAELTTGGLTAPAAGSSAVGPRHRAELSRGRVAGVLALALLLLAASVGVVVLLTGGRDPGAGAAQVPAGAPVEVRPTAPALPTPAPGTPLPAAALAASSVPVGRDGAAGRLTAAGLALEQRAVGVTVTTPVVSVSTDGSTSLVHATLPTWNCLSADVPADPAAAGCSPGRTEYAEATGPDLQLTRDGDALRLTGRLTTYTRPAGGPPEYTGRGYDLTVTLQPTAPARDGRAPAAGQVRLGPAGAPGTGELLLPG